ncbi:MAG: hypothetical protein JXA89_01505 [Anaerolineae bacterium]|nr:hypothetical protein [Anaerolineae bacterium]
MIERKEPTPWPVLKHYDQDHLARIALPLGGIGTGTVSLGGRGDLRDWEVINRPAKGFNPLVFFALYTGTADGQTTTRALEGPLEWFEYEGDFGSKAPNHGLPRFRQCRFSAAYPLGQVHLSDPDVPVDVRIEGFNPFIPGDPDRSGIPVAVLRYHLHNRTDQSLSASICGSLSNFIGQDGTCGASITNRNTFRDGNAVNGIFFESAGVDPTAEQWGSITLTTIKCAENETSARTAWLKSGWGTALLDFWDDFSEDGVLDEREGSGQDTPVGSLAIRITLPAQTTKTVTFALTWHFPNRHTWTPANDDHCSSANRIGNYYATRYDDAWDVAEQVAASLDGLEAMTVRFVRAFCDSDLPGVVKEAALFNLSTLRTQTCFRTPDGHLFGWEGSCDQRGCCHGSCTHVWNYEQATAFLFGDLAKTMREVEFAHATDDEGLMSFRVNLPLARAQEFGKAAADGQMGCILKMYRDWQLSGDDAWLKRLWPKVKKALTFCWIPGGWDADQDGVMEGCQHNTMDVEYYGPNPQMGAWYLGALRAAEEMARALGETEFADLCRSHFENGSRWIDTHLFNGEYYIQDIRPPGNDGAVAACLLIGMGARDLSKPDYQLGEGCLVDQLVGQFVAHVSGLGYLLDRDHVQQTLRSILKYNLRDGLHDHFNCMRSFALGEEAALLMAAYPKDRPRNPFPYFTEVMTGFEYTAAIGMLYEGQIGDGLRCIQNIRDRYDGRKRNPFNEAECGHHYARAMTSWAAVLALSGFHFSAVRQTMTFAAQNGCFFWSNGYAWGVCVLQKREQDFEIAIDVLYGELILSKFVLDPFGRHSFEPQARLKTGDTIQFTIAG